MSDRILDSSVLLAIFNNEPLKTNPSTFLAGAKISTVNLAEVLTKVGEIDALADERVTTLLSLLSRVEPFTESQAHSAAALRASTRHAGLSLGDRACLALAVELGAEVYTADRAWKLINIGVPIHLIR